MPTESLPTVESALPERRRLSDQGQTLRVLSVTDARSNATTYAYNNMDRLQTRTDPLLHAESYVYDTNGNLSTSTDRKSQVTSRTYDALDRLTQVTYADSSTITYTWDAGNRLTQITDSLSGTITRTYDLLDRLTQETSPQGTVSYTYDAAGRRTSLTVAGQPTVSYAYDNANRLTTITQGTNVVNIAYDTAGRRTSLTLPNGVVTEYGYDAASRLTGLTYKNGPATLGTLTYGYDSNGNRRQIGGTWARTGLPQPLASATYDTANRPLTFGGATPTHDFNGNLTSDGTTTYTWDARDRLSSLSATGTTASFQYDAVGRRLGKTLNGTTTTALHNGLDAAQETTGTTVRNIVTGVGIDEYLSHASTSGETRFALADALGSTIALADASGAVVTEYTYEPFGATVATGAPSENKAQYTGRENDGTGLYYYRARYYHPTLQRFVSGDPIGFAGGDVNLYAYVRNRPTQLVDPAGLAPYLLQGLCARGFVLSGRKDGCGGGGGDHGGGGGASGPGSSRGASGGGSVAGGGLAGGGPVGGGGPGGSGPGGGGPGGGGEAGGGNSGGQSGGSPGGGGVSVAGEGLKEATKLGAEATHNIHSGLTFITIGGLLAIAGGMGDSPVVVIVGGAIVVYGAADLALGLYQLHLLSTLVGPS